MKTVLQIFASFALTTICQADESIRQAVAEALPVIEAGSRGSAEERRCFTCHNQGLPILVTIEARKHGFQIDTENLTRQVKHTAAHLTRGKRNYEAGYGQGGKADTAGMALWVLGTAGHPPSEVSDAVVQFLLSWNADSPHWKPQSDRPPSEGSFFTSTYLALRGLQGYSREKHRERIAIRRDAALNWLVKTEPEETEDAVFRLRTLHLLGAETTPAAAHLLRLQRADGGWGQLPDLPTEAYSTGSTLVALRESGTLETNSEEFRRGIQFLLDSQRPDGTWHVESRSHPIQEPYESSFPHGEDQFISSSGTCWAILALLAGLEH
ncbi:MAG: hypothetical protein AAGH89_17435 [Verrucomicrobiota bacterium]